LLADRLNLLAYIRTMVLDQHVAEDVHQEVVVLALTSASAIVDEQHLHAWARRTAKYKCFEHLRAHQRQPQHIDPEVLELLEPAWQEESKNTVPEMSDALGACLEHLSARSRRMVDLRYDECLSGDQISQKLGLKLDSVYMAFSRIYRKLDLCVQQRLAAVNERHVSGRIK
jgi:RNA polymerase sigma-70 factor (ECF subfamily)